MPFSGDKYEATSGNNVLDGTDQITVVTGYRQISTLASAVSADATTITLVGDADQFNTTTKRYLSIDGIGPIDNYEVTGIAGNVLTVSPALHRAYAADAPVLIVKAITYSVNDAGFLTRNENAGGGAQPLVPNIETCRLLISLLIMTPGPTPREALRISGRYGLMCSRAPLFRTAVRDRPGP
jgi:hypothetical protein